jgi:ferric-dicitrate binding protein FerR (iron transport regulator)
MAEDHDLVRFLLGEMDDAELARFHDLLAKDPDKQRELKDLEMALHALRELRPERPRRRSLRRSLWLQRVAGLLLAFLAGAMAHDWLTAKEEPARADSQRELYDRYVEQPADRGSLSRLMVALGIAGRRN